MSNSAISFNIGLSNLVRGSLFSLLLLFISCGNKDNHIPDIAFNADSTAIEISNFDEDGFYSLEAYQRSGEPLDGLISVVESPGEDDSLSMEKVLTGTVLLKDRKIIFLPDSVMIAGKEYLISTFVNTKLGGSHEMVRKGLNTQGKPLQKTLVK